MGRMTRRLIVVAMVVLATGVAAAQSMTGGTTGTTTTGATGTPTTSSPSALATGGPTIDEIVSITRSVDPAASATPAFTVPPARRLVVTDVVITNPNATPMCGAAVTPGGATTTGTATTTTGTATTTGTPATTATSGTTAATTTPTVVESGTGPLCVPAQTSMSLTLTTGLEFSAGQSVLLANQPVTASATTGATTGATTAPTTAATAVGPLLYHLRGFLVSGV